MYHKWIVLLQIFWTDKIRDNYFKTQYNSFSDSLIKRLCVRIDNFFKKYTGGILGRNSVEIEIGYERYRCVTREEWIKGYAYKADRAIWNTYFDASTGQMIDSYSKVKEIEKTGRQYMTIREHEKMMKKNRDEQKSQTNQRIYKNLQQSLQELKQGKSFVKELYNKGNGKH